MAIPWNTNSSAVRSSGRLLKTSFGPRRPTIPHYLLKSNILCVTIVVVVVVVDVIIVIIIIICFQLWWKRIETLGTRRLWSQSILKFKSMSLCRWFCVTKRVIVYESITFVCLVISVLDVFIFVLSICKWIGVVCSHTAFWPSLFDFSFSLFVRTYVITILLISDKLK